MKKKVNIQSILFIYFINCQYYLLFNIYYLLFLEEDIFKIKKSSFSRRMAKQLERQKKKNNNKELIEEKELKKESSNEKDKIEEVKKEEKDDELNVIWIKSKPIETNNELPVIIDDDDDDDDEDDNEMEFNDEQYEKNESFPEFRGALQRGVIPDAKTIYVLKKQRQMAREAADFIALEDDQSDERYDESEKLENDRSDDDDEDDQRISFAVNKDQNEKEKIKEAFYLAQEEDQENDVKEESDDELDRWERQQIKKGVGMPSIRLLNQEQITSGTNLMEIENQDFKSKKQLIPSYILSRNKNKLTIEEAYSKLSDKLISLMESCESHKRQLSNLNNQIDFTKNHLKKFNANKSNNEQQ